MSNRELTRMGRAPVRAREPDPLGGGVLWRHPDTITVRPIRDGDEAALVAMHARLSPESRYQRYLNPGGASRAQIRALCRRDAGAGWVAVTGDGAVVAVAEYVVTGNAPRAAEIAFLVEDRYQGRGLGTRLRDALCHHAVVAGIHLLHAHIDPANRRMTRLLERSGYPYRSLLRDGLCEMTLLLRPEHAPVEGDWRLPPTVARKWPEPSRARPTATLLSLPAWRAPHAG